MPPLARLLRSALILCVVAAAVPVVAQDGLRTSPAVSSQQSAVAIAADLSAGSGGSTKLTLTLSKPTEARVFVMERPDRAVIDLAEVNFQLGPETGRRREGLVSSFRYGLFAPGRSRIVVDLAQPATVGRIETTTRTRDGAILLTVEFQKADRDAFRRAAVSNDPSPPSRKEAVAEPTDSRPLIMIDAGHGGIDPGAIAASGVFEKDIVFGFAQALVGKLEASGRYRVRMTRDRDVFVPLSERVRIAREASADLFVSIHADSISSRAAGAWRHHLYRLRESH